MTELPVKDKARGAIDKIQKFEKFGMILGLERMSELLELLGNPHEKLKVIHVAGTNGKGSVCRYIYSVLQAGGYKTGLYTSPFLEYFNERIEFDGKYISDEDLAVYTDKVLACVKQMTDKGHQSPTEFEVITAVAFLYFMEKQADYVVLEVGLGGRGDSTNVCKKPLVSVITSISYDHTDRLGNTLSEIASEKAGIIKEGCPVVTSAEEPEALEVIERTASAHSSMYFETGHIPYTIIEDNLHGCRFTANIQGVSYENMEITMAGEHQVKNAIAAIAALNIMEENGDIRLSRKNLYDGLKAARHNGRFELVSGDDSPFAIIIDGAHNPGGAEALADAMKKYCSGSRTLMVVGMLADKDISGILESFRRIADDFIATEPVNMRRLGANELREKIEALGGNCKAVCDYKEAVDTALQNADDYDVVLFAGSLYLIGAVRTYLREKRI